MSSRSQKYQPSGTRSDRRDMQRNRLVLSVKAGFLMPEVSPQPVVWRGMVKNISSRGMMLEIFSLDPDTYKQIIADQRYVIVYIPMPGRKEPVELKGKVVWLEYRPDNKPREICLVGLLFEELSADGTHHLQSLVNQAANHPDTSY